MKTKHIAVCSLLVALTLSGCSQSNNERNGREFPGEESILPLQTADLIEVIESDAMGAQVISFSAGEKSPSPVVTPEPTNSMEPIVSIQEQDEAVDNGAAVPSPTVTTRPAATPGPIVSPEPTATSKATATPNPTTTPKSTTSPPPVATPRPAATPRPTAAPTPVATPKPTTTPLPEQTPISIMPDPPAARTICNTCGADITGNVPVHGDEHLLNGEDFSYRVE